MFVALDKKNLYITADQVDKEKNKIKKQSYYCPACHEAVFLKKGAHIQPHFAHYAQHQCAVFSEGETQEHLEGKKLLFEWFKKADIPCQMEAYLPELQQRPDLLIWPEPDWPVAIEFQCSNLSVERMLERTEGYLQNGYDVFWIAGEKFHLKKRLTTFQYLFLKQHSHLGLYFLDLDTAQEQLTIHFRIQRPQPAGLCRFDTRRIDLVQPIQNAQSMLNAFLFEERKHRTVFSFLKSHDYLIRGRLYQDRKMIEFQKYIYTHGDSLISLPKEAYVPVHNELLIHTIPHFWKYNILCWLREMGVGRVFSKEDLETKINEMQLLGELRFYATPFVDEKTKLDIFNSYLSYLTEQQLISMISSQEWLILQLPCGYSNEQEKLTEFAKNDGKKTQEFYLS